VIRCNLDVYVVNSYFSLMGSVATDNWPTCTNDIRCMLYRAMQHMVVECVGFYQLMTSDMQTRCCKDECISVFCVCFFSSFKFIQYTQHMYI